MQTCLFHDTLLCLDWIDVMSELPLKARPPYKTANR
jgi:hypothetical protein